MRSANIEYEANRAQREMRAEQIERRFTVLWNALVVLGCVIGAVAVVGVALLVRWVTA
jgi:hypothetical protein